MLSFLGNITIFKTVAISALCALAFSFCDTLAAHWGRNGSLFALIGIFLLGPIGYLFFGYLNTRVELAVAGGLVNALIVVFTALAGTFVFGEVNLTHLQVSGLVMIIVGSCLVL